MIRLLYLLLLLTTVLTSCSNSATSGYIRNSGFVFGTEYNLIYRSDSDLCQAVLERLKTYDRSLSIYNKESLLSQLNEGDSIAADHDLLYVLENAKHFNCLSHGAFDVTVEPLSRAWRFTRDLENDTITVHQWQEILATVDTILPYIGLDKITIDGNIVRKADRRMKLNANALAEGYGIDLAAEVLEAHGVTDYMVEIGGEIHCKGLNPRGQKWRIGIDRPIVGNTDRSGGQCVIAITDCAVSTSGNYRQCYHVEDGRTVQHTIDPRLGTPVTHSMKSVTVVGTNTMTTDALCTSIMVLGPDSAIAFVSRIPQTEAYVVATDSLGNEIEIMTEGFREMIVSQR